MPGLGVPVGRRGIAVHGAEVAVAVHQGIAHGEVLSQADQGVVDRLASPWGWYRPSTSPTQVADFLKGLSAGQVILVHGVEDPAVDGLQAVPHVGQGPAHDDAHGVLNVGFLHLGDQR